MVSFFVLLYSKSMSEILVCNSEIKLIKLNSEHKKLLLSWLTDKRVLKFWEGEDEVFDLKRIEEDFFAAEDFEIIKTIIVYKGECVGYLQMYFLNKEQQSEYSYFGKDKLVSALDCFIGLPDKWGKGIGSKVMKLAKDYLVSRGAEVILIDPHTDNIRAIKCYEKSGFKKVKVLTRHELHNGKLVDCYLMECCLTC